MIFQRITLATIAAVATMNAAHAGLTGAGHEERGSAAVSVNIDSGKEPDGPEKIVARQPSSTGKHRLLSTNGWSELLLKDDSVFFQLTDSGMKKLDEPRRPQGNEGLFDGIMSNVALSAVKNLLDHSIALPLRETKSAVVRNGEVVVVTCNGKEVFNQVKFNGSVQKYPQDAAGEFVRNLLHARARFPACAK